MKKIAISIGHGEVYKPSQGGRVWDLYKGVESSGFKPTFVWNLNESLFDFDALIVSGPGVFKSSLFSDEEVKLVADFVKSGGGLILTGEAYRCIAACESYLNKLSEPFDVIFEFVSRIRDLSEVVNHNHPVTNGVGKYIFFGVDSWIARWPDYADVLAIYEWGDYTYATLLALEYGSGRAVFAVGTITSEPVNYGDSVFKVFVNSLNWVSKVI